MVSSAVALSSLTPTSRVVAVAVAAAVEPVVALAAVAAAKQRPSRAVAAAVEPVVALAAVVAADMPTAQRKTSMLRVHLRLADAPAAVTRPLVRFV
jgi:hypothetical protein